jgi:hypothetical protein
MDVKESLFGGRSVVLIWLGGAGEFLKKLERYLFVVTVQSFS